MSNPIKCPYCGTELLEGTSFCTHCMHSLIEKCEIPVCSKLPWYRRRLWVLFLTVLVAGVLVYFVTGGSYGRNGDEEMMPLQQSTGNVNICQHLYARATCGLPEVCTLCGETNGVATGEHEWNEEIRTVQHPEVGHWEETETERTKVLHYLCYYCGYDQDGYADLKDLREHMAIHSNQTDYGAVFSDLESHSEVREVWVPVYEAKWVVEKAAYEETVAVYTCVNCGETK